MRTSAALIVVLALAGCQPPLAIGRGQTEAGPWDARVDGDADVMDADADAPDADGGDGCTTPLRASKIASGDTHTCALSNEQILCWGHGLSGQLGSNVTATVYKPRLVSSLARFDDVTAMALGTCARRVHMQADENLEVMCWGENGSGSVGNGDVNGASVGVPVLTMPERTVAEMTGGESYMLARDANNVLWVWGANMNGQLGLGADNFVVRSPTMVAGSSVLKLAAGAHHACVTDALGHVLCAGDDSNGQLGNNVGTSPTRTFAAIMDSPVFTTLDAGMDRTCGVTEARALYCWGRNDPVIVPGVGNLEIPTRVSVHSDFKDVSVGFDTICALREGGRLFCFGNGEYGALGLGDTLDREELTEVTPGDFYKQVTIGRQFACAIRADNAVVCFGRNDDAQLGRPMGDTSSHPAVVCLD